SCVAFQVVSVLHTSPLIFLTTTTVFSAVFSFSFLCSSCNASVLYLPSSPTPRSSDLQDLRTIATAADVAAERADTTRQEMTDDRSEGTRLNSSHVSISYAAFCLKKNKILSDDLLLLQQMQHLVPRLNLILS